MQLEVQTKVSGVWHSTLGQPHLNLEPSPDVHVLFLQGIAVVVPLNRISLCVCCFLTALVHVIICL